MKRILLCLVCLLYFLRVIAQTANTSGQSTDFKLVFEKAYLHTDRDVYAQGDTLWFKAYLVNGQDNIPAKTSGTLYVDLIAPDVRIVTTEIIKLTDGYGTGDFDFIDAMPGGQYRLRAYTNWMRNFGDSFICEKNITVLNIPATPPIADKGNKTASKLPAVKKTTAPAPNINLPTVGFYPEGGSMLEGISALVAVKAESGSGKGINAKGVVLTSTGDTITRFVCDDTGMGLFSLLPVKGEVYHSAVRLELPNNVKRDVIVPLPIVLNKGLALQVKQNDSLLHLVISTADLGDHADKPKYAVSVKHAGQTLVSENIQVDAPQMLIKIVTTQLPEGISAITLYDERGRPNCERLIYIQHKTTFRGTVTTDSKSYHPYQKTTVQINTGQVANLSVAVIDAAAVPEQADNIVAYLMLGSELKGNVEHAARYFDTTNVNRVKQLNLLMLTQGWRDFIWRRLADTTIHISYAAEDGVNVAGYVRDEINHKAIPALNVTMYASAVKGQTMYSTRSDANGHFAVTDLSLYGKQSIKLSAVNDKGVKKGSFEMDTLSTPKVKPLVATTAADGITDTLTATNQAMLQKVLINKTARGITNLKEVTVQAQKKEVVVDDGFTTPTHFMTFGPSQLFFPAPKDYWTKTLSWYVNQMAKGAVIPDPAKSPGVAFLNGAKRTYPILVVNGSMYHIDPNLYWNMPIEKFKRIELQPYSRGMGIGYLLLLTLKEDALTDNPGTLNLNVQGYYEARAFFKPNYDVGDQSKPDLRSTIHWEPNVKTDMNGNATLSFYNATNKGPVRVIVQGVTQSGTPVSPVTTYEVK